jgi:hypothetical protein
MNSNYNNINTNHNNNNNITDINNTYYNMNTEDINNFKKDNYSFDFYKNINYQDNNIILYKNQKQSLYNKDNNYASQIINNQNDMSTTININSFSPQENELISANNIFRASDYDKNINNISISSKNNIHNNNNYHNNYNNHEICYDIKIIEATKKIPIIRFYVFIKKLKAKCIIKILYQISYILSLFDINKRINILNSIPFQLPIILQKIFLINFPIKVIRSIIPDYKNYHIPTTQEIVAPFLELIISLSSVPIIRNPVSNNHVNELLHHSNENNYPLYENVNNNDAYQNKNEKENNSKFTMSPLVLPQTELPCKNSPENIRIIQTPSTFLNKDATQCNLETKKNVDHSKSNEVQVNSHSIFSSNKVSNDNIFTELFSNDSNLKHNINTLPEKKTMTDVSINSNGILNDNNSIININSKNDSEAPYNFLANNMKLQSNLTLFPLSPYITLKNSDFETDIPPISSESSNDKNTLNLSNANGMSVSSISSSNQTTTLNVSTSPAATLSTVAASIAALKCSSTSSKHNESSLSKKEKRNLSMIKGSNIVKNIVKNFEEINAFYKNSLLKAAENINNTKLAKRNSSKKSNNSENNNKINNEVEIDNYSKENDENIEKESILEDEIRQEPIEDIELISNNDIDNILVNNDNENNKNENILSNEDRLLESETNFELSDPPAFLKESDLATIRESTAILNSYYCDPNVNFNGNEGITEIIKDFSLEENDEADSETSSNSEVSNAIFNSLVNIEDLDITRLTILLIESFVKLSDTEKDEFLNSEYFDLIKSHVMNIQNDDEIEFNNVLKDPKMLNEFESHIEALQQCVKERDDIINYYYQEIVNERIQNEKLLIFCENEQLERQETNKVISGLTQKIEMEEDYIKKLEVRCEMLIEKIKKYQSCCKHYEKSISLLSGKKANSLKLINTQNIDNWKMNDLTEPLSATSILTNPPSFTPTASQTVAASAALSNYKDYPVNVNNNAKLEKSSSSCSNSSSSSTLNNEAASRPTIAHLINKLSCEKISKNEEIQYLKSLLKSYNGKHIYINENVIKREIIKKTISDSQSIPATVETVPVIPVSVGNPNTETKKLSSSKKMMMEKYLDDENQYSKIENTLVVNDDEDVEEQEKNEMEFIVEEDDENDDNDLMKNGGKSIDLSIIDDLNIFNEKHYQEKVLNKHQEYIKSYDEDTFSEYAPTLVN